jgi:hypothetical protein
MGPAVVAGVSEGPAVTGTIGDWVISGRDTGVEIGVGIAAGIGAGEGVVGEPGKQPFLISP